MTKELRAQIDNETFKGLLAINGGGAVALLSFLAATLNGDGARSMRPAILCGLVILVFGLAFAVAHNHLRRQCSLAHDNSVPNGRLFGVDLLEPMVCYFSWKFMWASLGCFMIAVVLVAVVGLMKLPV